jgi:RNA polymerase sigma-70 factor (ECF subfamily)
MSLRSPEEQTMPTRKDAFPTTDWGLLKNLRGNSPALREAGLNLLAGRYWRPVYGFLRRSGHDDAEAKDLTQAFFAAWLENDGFAKADQDKGRLRSLMLTSLKRFVSNERRSDNAQRRKPAAGLVSLDALMESEEHPFEPRDEGMTPDKVFDRRWAVGVMTRVLKRLEAECETTGKSAHYDIFVRRIIAPILHGADEQSLADLGTHHGMTEKQAGNCLLTAKRACRRLMEEEVRLYTETAAEVADEIRELFLVLA